MGRRRGNQGTGSMDIWHKNMDGLTDAWIDADRPEGHFFSSTTESKDFSTPGHHGWMD